MNDSVRRRRESRGVNFRPALLWFAIVCVLLGLLVGAAWLVSRSPLGEWLSLKMDSARVRLLEHLPQPEHPELVPTPLRVAAKRDLPTRSVTRLSTATRTGLAPIDALLATATLSTPERDGPTSDMSLRIRFTPVTGGGGCPSRPGCNDALSATPSSQKHTRLVSQCDDGVASCTLRRDRHSRLYATPTPTPNVLLPVQASVKLIGVIHEPQRFNNCGPTTLRMYFTFFGFMEDSQVEIASVLKPNKDDRNVSPEELTGYARTRGFETQVRVNGDFDRIKLFLSNGLPVVVETGFDPPRAKKGWMGHYRLITGYDEHGVITQDSYNGPDQFVTWQELDAVWRHFNRTYWLIYPHDKAPVVNAIIGPDLDDATMYARAAQRAQEEWNANPNDGFAAFNLGSSLVGLKEYEAAAYAFDQARLLKLPWRMMWYQFGPYEAYLNVGRYEEVIALADATQRTVGDLEESYYYKGLALERLGRFAEARQAFELALKYNPNYALARQALARLPRS